ncbi:MAG: MFS transporter, partial [Desulfomonile tiedjei]|nr:MFS transporter [Desulfomonile tiedjei]
MNVVEDPAPGSWRRWAIFVIGSINFMLSMFYRVSTAVISPSLVRDLGFSSTQLSDLSAVFFYAFAASQIPIGIALDRLGVRLTLAILSVSGISGVLLFALGETPNHLIFARVLLGIGVSGNLMIVLALFAAWFPVDRFGFLSGLVVAVGVLGTLVGATPLALMNLWIGWRASFLVFAVVNSIVVLAFIWVARDKPPGRASFALKSEAFPGGLAGLFGMYSYWAISLSSFVRYGYIAALQGLWATPFLIYGLGMDEIAASNVLFCLGLGYMVSLPVSGYLSDTVLRSRKQVLLASLSIFSVLAFSIIWWTQSVPHWLVVGTFFGLGCASGPGQIMYAHMKELIPPAMIARAMTAVNLFTVLGAGIMTHILGLVVGSEPSKLTCPEDFKFMWYVGGISLALACV